MPNDETNKYAMDSKNDFGLRKSKSYNGPDNKFCQHTSEELSLSSKFQPKEFYVNDLRFFPEDISEMAKRIVKGIPILINYCCVIILN